MKNLKLRSLINLIRLSLLIIFLVSCVSVPVEEPKVVYIRPIAPEIPKIKFIDIPGYYGLDDTTTDMDDLIRFMIDYKAYIKKVQEVLDKYEQLE